MLRKISTAVFLLAAIELQETDAVWHFTECLKSVCKEVVGIIFRRRQYTRTRKCVSSEEWILIKLRYAVPRPTNIFHCIRQWFNRIGVGVFSNLTNEFYVERLRGANQNEKNDK